MLALIPVYFPICINAPLFAWPYAVWLLKARLVKQKLGSSSCCCIVCRCEISVDVRCRFENKRDERSVRRWSDWTNSSGDGKSNGRQVWALWSVLEHTLFHSVAISLSESHFYLCQEGHVFVTVCLSFVRSTRTCGRTLERIILGIQRVAKSESS